MSKTLQSDVLSVRTIKKVMPACMIYSLVQSMTFMVDTVLAGHFLGTDAVAAVAIGLPIIGIMISFSAMILHGGYLKMLKYLGRSDMEGYNRIFSVVLVLTILVDILFLGLCFGATDALVGISGGAKATAQAAAYGDLYMRTACLMILFFVVGTAFQLVSTTFGYMKDVMISSAVNVVVNIVVSAAAIQMLSPEYKIAGLGIGSAVGAFSQMIAALLLIFRRNIKIRFRFYPPNLHNIRESLDCIRMGVPSSVDNILDSACGSVVNNIVLSVFANGTSVLALVAVIKTINTLVRTIGKGTLFASESLIGILFGARDTGGICSVFKTSLKLGLLYAAALGAVIICLQQPILTFYGVSHIWDARMGLILIALSGMVAVFPFMLNSVYESTEHLLLSFVVAVIPDSILYPAFVAVLGERAGVTGIWLAMGFSFLPFFAVYYLIFILINRRPVVPLEKLLMLKTFKNRETAMDVSIPAAAVQVSFVSESLQRFFLAQDAPPRLAHISALCMEEIAADYIAHRQKTRRGNDEAYMDIKAFRDPDKIEIILRNYDEPYNPLLIEHDGTEDDSFSKIGIVMTQRIASSILYSYAYHLNVVSVIIPTAE